MGLGHCYCGEIDTSIIAWYRSLGIRIPRSSWDEFRPLLGFGTVKISPSLCELEKKSSMCCVLELLK